MSVKYTCAKLSSVTAPEAPSTVCAAAEGLRLQALAQHDVKCPAGHALSAWRLTGAGCAFAEEGHMRLAGNCTDLSSFSSSADTCQVEASATEGVYDAR